MINVTIATPMRHYSGPKDLPHGLGVAFRELAQRKDPAFRAEAEKYNFSFLVAVGGLCRARNTCVHEFLNDKGGEFLLWIDSDLEKWDEHTLADAILRILSHRQPVAGALYCKRAKRPQWVATWMPAAEVQPSADGLLQVVELGTGFKCYHRKVFTELARIYPQIIYRERETGREIAGFYQNLVHDGDLLSEDYHLDALCRAASIPILADTKIKLRHVEPDGTQYPEADFPPIPALDRAP